MDKLEFEYIKQGLKQRLLNTSLLNINRRCNDLSIIFEGIANENLDKWFKEIEGELDGIKEADSQEVGINSDY